MSSDFSLKKQPKKTLEDNWWVQINKLFAKVDAHAQNRRISHETALDELVKTDPLKDDCRTLCRTNEGRLRIGYAFMVRRDDYLAGVHFREIDESYRARLERAKAAETKKKMDENFGS